MWTYASWCPETAFSSTRRGGLYFEAHPVSDEELKTGGLRVGLQGNTRKVAALEEFCVAVRFFPPPGREGLRESCSRNDDWNMLDRL